MQSSEPNNFLLYNRCAIRFCLQIGLINSNYFVEKMRKQRLCARFVFYFTKVISLSGLVCHITRLSIKMLYLFW